MVVKEAFSEEVTLLQDLRQGAGMSGQAKSHNRKAKDLGVCLPVTGDWGMGGRGEFGSRSKDRALWAMVNILNCMLRALRREQTHV